MRERAAAAAAAKAEFRANVVGARGAAIVHDDDASGVSVGAGAAVEAKLPAKHRIVPIAPVGVHFATVDEAAASAAAVASGVCVPADIDWWDAAFLPPARTREFAARASAGAAAYAAALSGTSTAAADVVATPPPVFSHAECALTNAKTAALVQHPVPIVTAADVEALTPRPVPLILTVAERRKARRLTRAARLQEEQDQIRIGLLPPPEPRMRIANLMRVLKDAAVADPSALEARVRAQVADRVAKHDAANAARKLTQEQQRDKWRRSMATHGPQGPEAALLRVSDLSHGKNRYKVDVCARKMFLGGVVLECRAAGCALIYVEGGMRAVSKYVRLMAQRINWRLKSRAAGDGEEDDDIDGEAEDDDDEAGTGDAQALGAAAGVTARGYGSGPGSVCELVWRGISMQHHFATPASGVAAGSASTVANGELEPSFTWEEARSAAAARKALATKGLESYWDAVLHSHEAAMAATAQAGDDAGGGLVGSALLAHIRERFAQGSGLLGGAPAAEQK